jgi:sialidase-1
MDLRSGSDAMPIVISRGGPAGPYQAFPDVCRARDGRLIAVFYAGFGHVSLPGKKPDWPRGGRLCRVFSEDEGRTWTTPEILFDGPNDDRDSHIAVLPDGRLACTFFTLRPSQSDSRGFESDGGVRLVLSRDGGRTWGEPRTLADGWYCSAPVRVLPGGVLLLGIYYMRGDDQWGGVLRSADGGETWGEPIPIGKGQRLPLDAETDVIALKDGSIFAALRSSAVNMHFALSPDGGRTWGPARDMGFKGHAPHLYRLSTGEILLSHRLPDTALHVSRDEGRTWQGPFVLDAVPGAYPSCVERRDGSVLAVYYEEGEGSAVRARRFRLTREGIELLPLTPARGEAT